jgi:putative ABC transport system permease protein
MFRLAVRSLLARKLRTALTAVAVVLGVAMVSGTYVETDQIRSAFEDISEQSVAKADVIVSPPEAFTASFTSEPPTLDASLVRRITGIDGVAAAEGEMTSMGQMIVDGEPVETNGAPALVSATGSERFDPTTLVEGHQPQGPGEASILVGNASEQGIDIGDRIGVATRHGERSVTVVGLFSFGGGGAALGGTTSVRLDDSQFRSWFDMRGKVNAIDVAAVDGVDAETLRDRIAADVGSAAEVQTAAESASETSEEINDQIGSFLTPALLALAGAAVLVGAFIIFNTFSITVAQRVREFALLRAVGSTRSQIMRSVAGEAVVLGTVSSIVGLGAGVGFSKLMNALFDAVGFGIPRSGVVLEPRTVIVAFVVGVGTTLAASVVPALRATRVSPVAAMAGSSAQSARHRRVTAAATVLLAVLGLLLTAKGLFGSGAATARLGAMSVGAIAIFIGVGLSARYIVKPLAGFVGWPIERLFGATGKLARDNAQRDPARTATTSAALMVGLALVVFVAVFATSLKSSLTGQVDRLITADLIVRGANFTAFPGRSLEAIRATPGVADASPVEYDQVEVNGEPSSITTDVVLAVDPERIASGYRFNWIDGDDGLLKKLDRRDNVLIEEQFAKAHDLGVGDSYSVVTPSGGTATLRVIGEYRDPTILQGSIASLATLHSISPSRDPMTIFVATDPEADAGEVQARIDHALRTFPGVEVETHDEYEDTVSGQLNQIVYMLYALLGMSVLISLFGIANSLFLAIHERAREIGVLRAIGTTSSQIRQIVRLESVITAVIGGLLGTLCGLAFGALVVASLSELGLELGIPTVELAVLLVVAGVVGVIASIPPARRAARMNVLRAIAQE